LTPEEVVVVVVVVEMDVAVVVDDGGSNVNRLSTLAREVGENGRSEGQ